MLSIFVLRRFDCILLFFHFQNQLGMDLSLLMGLFVSSEEKGARRVELNSTTTGTGVRCAMTHGTWLMPPLLAGKPTSPEPLRLTPSAGPMDRALVPFGLIT